MTKEEAFQIMRTSKTIQEWNENREIVMNKCTNKEWNDIYWQIDASGLVVEVLGKDDEETLRNNKNK
jgi:hypothetical protein